MLSKELFVAVLLIGLLATIFGGVLTATTIGADEENDLKALMSPFEKFVEFNGIYMIGGILPFPKLEFPWATAVWNTITFQSPLFESTAGQYVQWALLLGFGVVIAFGFGMWIITVIRGGGG